MLNRRKKATVVLCSDVVIPSAYIEGRCADGGGVGSRPQVSRAVKLTKARLEAARNVTRKKVHALEAAGGA